MKFMKEKLKRTCAELGGASRGVLFAWVAARMPAQQHKKRRTPAEERELFFVKNAIDGVVGVVVVVVVVVRVCCGSLSE